MQWYKMFWEKFDNGTKKMTDAQVGCYIRLLHYQMDKGSLPSDLSELKDITGSRESTIVKVISMKFKVIRLKTGDSTEIKRYSNKRMEITRAEVVDIQNVQSKNGSKKKSHGFLFPEPSEEIREEETREEEIRKEFSSVVTDAGEDDVLTAEDWKEAKRLTEARKKDGAVPLWKNFITAYDEWYFNRTHSPARFIGVDASALKKIYSHCVKISKSQQLQQDDVYNHALDIWNAILGNWSKLEPHIQNGVSLPRIIHNLPEIINQIKNGPAKKLFTAAQTAADNSEQIAQHFAQRAGKN